MGITERIVTGKWVKGKKMNEPYLTIWKSIMAAIAVIIFGLGVQLLGWVSDYINYVLR